MDDKKIVDLYFARNEDAIKQTREKYEKLLYRVSYNIVNCDPDAEECVSDTYMCAWRSMPPTRPSHLSAFLTKIARNISLNKYRQNKSRRRVINNEVILDELSECIPDRGTDIASELELRDLIDGFLSGLATNNRIVFVKRYFYMKNIVEIATEMNVTPSSVKVSLYRSRRELREYLERAGISI